MVRDTSESFAIEDQIARITGITKVEASARKFLRAGLHHNKAYQHSDNNDSACYC